MTAEDLVSAIAPVHATADRGHDVIAFAGVDQGAQPRVDFDPVVAVEETEAKTKLPGRDTTRWAPHVHVVRMAARPERELATPRGKVKPTMEANPQKRRRSRRFGIDPDLSVLARQLAITKDLPIERD